MRDRELALFTAEQAVGAQFRQTAAMSTRDFARFLSDRGLSVSTHDLDRLAQSGLVDPVAVTSMSPLGSRSYPPLITGREGRTYGVRGRPFDAARLRRPNSARELAAWWHPFQLWQVDRIPMVAVRSSVRSRGSFTSIRSQGSGGLWKEPLKSPS